MMNNRDAIFDSIRLPLDRKINEHTTGELRRILMDTAWNDAWAETRNMNVNSMLKILVDDELERLIK